MFDKTNSTVSQGTIGYSAAIFYYQSQGYNVLMPLVDNQFYDLVIEKDSEFQTVQCKTTGRQPYASNDNYMVELKSIRANKTKNKIHNLPNCDLLFILCGDGTMYSIPRALLKTKKSLSLNKDWDKYKIGRFRPTVGNTV